MSAILNGGLPVTPAAVRAALAADPAAGRSSLGLGGAALLGAGEAEGDVGLRSFVAAMVGAITHRTLTVRPGAVGALIADDLSSTPFGAFTYSGSPAFTLTRTVNGALGIPLGVSALVAFTVSDQARGGLYTVTDEGAVGRPFVLTRRADSDASGDFADDLAFVVGGMGNRLRLLRMVVGGSFVLDTDPVTFDDVSAYVPLRFTVANLPTTPDDGATEGGTAYAIDGRKVGEGAGSGTGVPVYFSNGSWRVYATDAAVTA